MTDLERRLRDALHAATEPAPAGLLDAVLRRHRRHRLRVGASLVAALAAATLATSSLAGALSGGPAGHGGPVVFPSAGRSTPGHPSLRPVAAPGTVLSGCPANAGALSKHWRRLWRKGLSTHAGPMWFLGGGHSAGTVGRNTVTLYVAIALLDRVAAGSTVVVRVAPGWRRDLRFLYGPKDSLNPGTKYTMRSGEPGVTFVSCRPGQEIFPSRHITDYYGGYLIRGPRCVPVRVWVPGQRKPLTARLGACPRH